MNQTNIFTHFAQRSGTPERYATDALCFILQRSATAREALREFFRQRGVELPEKLYFENQLVCGDGSIPDLTALDEQSHRVLLIECKYWAVLTNRQPISYLGLLTPDEPGLLAFIAPAVRVPKLWNELLSRCRDASISMQPFPPSQVADDCCIASVQGSSTILAAVSWRQLLNSLDDALKQAGELAVAADVQQLQGLCEAMDEAAFLPLRAEELDPYGGLRLHQFGMLIDRIFEALETAATPWLTPSGRWEAGPGAFGKNLQMHGISAWFGISGEHWATMRATPEIATPMWIEFYTDRTLIHRLHQQLRGLGDEESRLRSFDDPAVGPNISVAIDLLIGTDEQRLIKGVVQQLNEIAAAISPPV